MRKSKFEGKVAVISGGSSGIGLAIAHRLHENNVKIYDISKDEAKETIFAKAFVCDISDDVAMKNIVEEIVKLEGKIDFLFCNAGFGIGGLFENASISTIDKIMNVNLISHMKMTNLFLPYIRDGGKILFTGSLASIIPLPYQACYSASKAGIENFSRAIANELRPRKISITTFMPGDINTNFTAARIKQTGDDKTENRGIMKMEKAERKGKTPDYVAKRVMKVVKKHNPPLRVSIGGTGKFISFLVKIVSTKMLNFLVRHIYT